MTIYRNRLQDIELDRDLLIYIENVRERKRGRKERHRSKDRIDRGCER